MPVPQLPDLVHSSQDPQTLSNSLKQAAQQLGFDQVGIASLRSPPHLASLQEWLAAGYQADMDWMDNPHRQDPDQVLQGVRSVVCVAMNYYTPHPHSSDPSRARISRYAWGRDYHRVLGRRLKAFCQWLSTELPESRSRWYVDTGPVMEKPWAQQAGLGWIGKNSLLLTREWGSWIFLGVVLTTLDLDPDPPHPNHCGTCTRCLQACPTQAIVAEGVVDARLCLAYQTLENQAEVIPPQVGKQMQSWVAGCDICQDVCPWNRRFAKPTQIEDFQPYPWNQAPSLGELVSLSDSEFDQRFRASALRRVKVGRLRRNARAALDSVESDCSRSSCT
ncbi:MAG: tRNA epoxyqueuosine(34) reductase QueG [Synechococcaceae cyanobacterium SM2_3_1]|nr:tRNA epoxyqueuosine(34) reductase QueG [Synechococcaceae cyanobacterium SM2_3_1]